MSVLGHVALRNCVILYNIADYTAMKATASNTWACIVLPGHVRACFFCGDICSYARKEMPCEDISDMLREQHALAGTDIFHGTMRNMLHECQEAYAHTASEQSEQSGRVVACTACYNWIMHRRQSSTVMYNFGVGPRFAFVSASARAPK